MKPWSAALTGALALALANPSPSPAQILCSWEEDDDGFWTTSPNQIDPATPSNWDCPAFNFPSNLFVPAEVFFTAQIGDGHTVTVTPILPILVSNLTLTDSSSVALVDGSNLFIQNTGAAGVVDSDGTITLDNLAGALSTNLTVDGNVTFTGGGSVTLGGPGTAVSGNHAVNLSATLIVEDHTIQGSGALGAESMSLRVNGGGTVRANTPLEVLEIDPGTDNNVANAGLMEATGGGTLRIKQTAINNAGGTISAGTASLVELQEVTLFSGELTGSGVVRGISTVTLEGPVTNSGTYAVGNGTATLLDGHLTNSSQVTIAGGSFLAETPSSLSGGGTVTLGIPPGATSTLGAVFDSGATLDNIDNTINGGGNISVPLTNSGTVTADEPTAPLRVIRSATNLATMTATGGATLNIRGAVENSGGAVAATDGTIAIDHGGSLTGGTITVQPGSRLEIADGAVDATVDNSPGGTIAATQFATNILNGTISNPAGAEIVVHDNAALVLSTGGLYQVAGTIHLTGEGQFASFANCALVLDGPVTLQGGGDLAMSNSSKNVILAQSGTGGALVNQDLTIHGSGQVGRNGTGIENHGTIVADLPPTAEPGTGLLTIDPGAPAMVNTGSLGATNGATLQLRDGDYHNSGGTIGATGGATIALEAAADISGGTVHADTGSHAEVRRDATFDGVADPIEIDAAVRVTELGLLRLTGEVTNRKTITVENGGRLRIDGPVTLDGGGEIHLAGTDSRLVNFQDSIPGDLLINVDNRISGTGLVQFLEIENRGTLAPGSSPGTLVTGALTQTSTATLEIEVRSSEAGDFDVLQAQAPVTLAGTLRVVALPGIDVSAGETFDILVSGGITGAFDAVEIPTTPGGSPLFSLSQAGNNLRLTALEDARPVTYEDWATLEGLTLADGAPGDDPNRDGLSNLGAYFLGLPALGSTAGTGIDGELTPAGDFVFTFSSPLTVTGVAATTQTSSDLTPPSWLPGPPPVATATTATHTHYQVTVPGPGPGTRLFSRLVFSLDPAP